MDALPIVILLAVAGGLIAYSVVPRKREGRDTLRRRLEGRSGGHEPDPIDIARDAASQKNLVKKATPVLSRLIMPVSTEEQSVLRSKLISAGFRSSQAQTVFLASKTAVMALGVIAGVTLGVSFGFDLKLIVGAAMFAGGVGFIAPGMWLDMATRSRQDKVRRGLPDVLDLMVVSVESGLALDSALKRVGEEMALVHPEVSEEFRIATGETQMGIPRGESLENMARRVGLDELRSLVSVIAQAERFGTSVATALRNQGEAMRTKRRQQAEERAQKTAVKLMIPLVMFIFPAMGVVLAGPAAIRLVEAFVK
jgi:tight adherence protein C